MNLSEMIKSQQTDTAQIQSISNMQSEIDRLNKLVLTLNEENQNNHELLMKSEELHLQIKNLEAQIENLKKNNNQIENEKIELNKQLTIKKEKIEALNVKLIAEARKPSKVEKHYYTSDKCRKCEIDRLKDSFEYLDNISSVMLVYILILNIALILKNNIFRTDIFSFLYAFINFVCTSAKSMWCFIDNISQITYKINNVVCANILHWVLIIILLAIALAIIVFIGYFLSVLLKIGLERWDTTQSCIFITIITLVSYVSDMLNIKIFNANLLTIILILFVISIAVRIIYYKKQKG